MVEHEGNDLSRDRIGQWDVLGQPLSLAFAASSVRAAGRRPEDLPVQRVRAAAGKLNYAAAKASARVALRTLTVGAAGRSK